MSDEPSTSRVAPIVGVIVGLPLLDVDVAVWQSVAASGVGALLNLAYRWSESAVQEG